MTCDLRCFLLTRRTANHRIDSAPKKICDRLLADDGTRILARSPHRLSPGAKHPNYRGERRPRRNSDR